MIPYPIVPMSQNDKAAQFDDWVWSTRSVIEDAKDPSAPETAAVVIAYMAAYAVYAFCDDLEWCPPYPVLAAAVGITPDRAQKLEWWLEERGHFTSIRGTEK